MLKWIDSVSKALSLVAIGLILPMMLLIIFDVLLRFLFSSPITGTPEIASMMLVCMVLGISWCAVEGRHIKIDLFVSRFPQKLQDILDAIFIVGGLFISIIITWQGIKSIFWMYKTNVVLTTLLPVPAYPFWCVYSLGWIMFCLILINLLIKKVWLLIRNEP